MDIQLLFDTWPTELQEEVLQLVKERWYELYRCNFTDEELEDGEFE